MRVFYLAFLIIASLSIWGCGRDNDTPKQTLIDELGQFVVSDIYDIHSGDIAILEMLYFCMVFVEQTDTPHICVTVVKYTVNGVLFFGELSHDRGATGVLTNIYQHDYTQYVLDLDADFDMNELELMWGTKLELRRGYYDEQEINQYINKR